MLRKITTILLSIALLLTLCPVTGVFAAVDVQTTIKEDFNDMNVTDSYFAFADSQLDSIPFIASANGKYEAYKIVEKTGADGKTSNMLEMRSPVGTSAASHWVGLKLPQYESTDLSAGDILAYSFDFYIENIPTSNSVFAVNPYLHMFYHNDSGGLFNNSANFNSTDLVIGVSTSEAGSRQARLAKGSWYRAETVIGNDEYLHFAIYDKNGSKLFVASSGASIDTYCNTSLKSTKYADRFLGSIALGPVVTADTGFTVLMDNLEYSVYTTATAPSIKTGSYFTQSSIKDGDVVSLATNTAIVVFDQKLKDGYKATITPDGGEATVCTMTEGKAYANSYTYTVALPELEASKTYTLSFADCKNSSGTPSSSSISFSTQGGGELVIRDKSLDDGAEISPIGATVTVTFDQPLSADSEVVVYEEGGAKLACTLTPAGDNTYTVALPELEEDKTYILDFTGCKNDEGVACTTKISLKTWITDMIKYTDDFETNLIDDTKSGYKGYNTANNESSPLYSGSRSTDSGTISRVAGYKGGNALQLATSGGNTYTGSHISALNTSNLYTPAFNPDTNQYEQFVLTYRFRIDKAADYNTTFVLDEEEYTTTGTNINFYSHNVHNLDYDRVIARIVNSEDKLVIKPGRHATWELNSYYQPEIAEDKWYNIVWVVDGVNQTFNLIDTATGKMIFTCSAELAIPEGGHKFNIFNGNWARNTTKKTIDNQNQTILIDDFTLWQIKPWETKQKLDLASEATVSGNMVTFNFNQPVLAKMNMLNVTKGSNEKAYSIPTITYTDFCTSEVSFSNLVAGQRYIVDYKAAKGVSGADFSDDSENELEITMAAPNKAVSLNAEVTGAEIDDTVTFDFWAEEAGETTFIAAFYDNAVEKELVGVETVKLSVNAGENPITITLENDYSAKAQELEIFTWSDLTNIKPLTEKTVKLPCSNTLKVLLIGNSLSEDANRHLNNVAALGGLELDLTVAGIGGSGLPIHSANLKAELAGRTKEDALALIEEMKAEDPNASTPFLYWIYDNGVGRGTSYIKRERLLDMLTAKEYDVISLQQYDHYEDSGFEESLPYLAEQIRKLQPDAELVLYQTWSESYKLRESRSLLFDIIKAPANEKWAALTPKLVSGITKGNVPMRIIPAGTAFYVADEMYEIFGEKLPGNEGNTNEGTQDDNANDFSVASSLWRDKNHASFYGCYLADAVWFECLTGRKAPIGTKDAPAVPRPSNADITPEEHIERLGYLSDIAHSVVMARR